METKTAVISLAALAQESRLAIFRMLVQQGANGLPAGKIAEQLNMAPSSLSFHLKELSHAGLIQARHEGRSIIYTANYVVMSDLIDFLTKNCCQGASCLTVSSFVCTDIKKPKEASYDN